MMVIASSPRRGNFDQSTNKKPLVGTSDDAWEEGGDQDRETHRCLRANRFGKDRAPSPWAFDCMHPLDSPALTQINNGSYACPRGRIGRPAAHRGHAA